MAAFRVIHSAIYRFDPPAEAVSLTLRLRPLPRAGQSERRARVACHPDCMGRTLGTDAYGNAIDEMRIIGALRRLQIDGDVTIELAGALTLPYHPPGSLDLLSEAGVASARNKVGAESCHAIIAGSADGWSYDDRLGHQTLGEIARTRRGACEDVARLAVEHLRWAGIPARLVVGYAAPHSMTGTQPTRRHAWVAAFSDDDGWIEADPLDPAGSAHLIATAWGPTLCSVAPVEGVFGRGKARLDSMASQIVRLA